MPEGPETQKLGQAVTSGVVAAHLPVAECQWQLVLTMAPYDH